MNKNKLFIIGGVVLLGIIWFASGSSIDIAKANQMIAEKVSKVCGTDDGCARDLQGIVADCKITMLDPEPFLKCSSDGIDKYQKH